MRGTRTTLPAQVAGIGRTRGGGVAASEEIGSTLTHSNGVRDRFRHMSVLGWLSSMTKSHRTSKRHVRSSLAICTPMDRTTLMSNKNVTELDAKTARPLSRQ